MKRIDWEEAYMSATGVRMSSEFNKRVTAGELLMAAYRQLGIDPPATYPVRDGAPSVLHLRAETMCAITTLLVSLWNHGGTLDKFVFDSARQTAINMIDARWGPTPNNGDES